MTTNVENGTPPAAAAAPAPQAAPPVVARPVLDFSPELLQRALDELEKRNAQRPPTGSAIHTALSNLQGAIRSIVKNKEADAGAYSFTFASLDAIWEVIREHVFANKLSILQPASHDPQTKIVQVVTRITHAPTTEFVESPPLRFLCPRPDPQSVGAVISYAQRYSLKAMLGITQKDENEEQVLNDIRSQPPPVSTQRPPRQAAPPKASPPPAAKQPKDEPPISVDEMIQHMESCANKGELAQVAARISGKFHGAERERLLKVYKARLAEFEGAK